MKLAPISHIEWLEAHETGRLPKMDDPIKWTPYCFNCKHFAPRSKWCKKHNEETHEERPAKPLCNDHKYKDAGPQPILKYLKQQNP